MKKEKIFIGCMLFILIAVFIVNWYYAEIIKETIELGITKASNEEFVYEYGNILVNPLRRQTIIQDLLVYDKEGAKLKYGELEIQLTWEDVRKLIMNGEINELRELSIRAKNMVYQDYEDSPKLCFNSFSIEYDGCITDQMIYDPLLILDQPQKITISIKDIMMMDFAYEDELDIPIDVLEEFFTINEVSFTANYHPENRRVEIDEIKASNSDLNFNGSISSNFEMKGFKSKIPDFMKEELKKLFINTEALGELSIDELSMNWAYDKGEVVFASKLITPALCAILDVEAFDDEDPLIKEAKLKIFNLSDEVIEMVQFLEYLMGIALPRVSDLQIKESSY
ncbi:MAG: hypothetical protein KAX49_17915 [Halanaerobiales bacterium]|nr:hypothetical protein [Halanaerobiales bacterium]